MGKVEVEEGISAQLLGPEDASGKQPVFMLPGNLACWFNAPAGSCSADAGRIENPDWLVTGDALQTREQVIEGPHSGWQ